MRYSNLIPLIKIVFLVAAFIAAFVFAEDSKTETQQQKHNRIIQDIVNNPPKTDPIQIPQSKSYLLTEKDHQIAEQSRNNHYQLSAQDHQNVANTVRLMQDFNAGKTNNLNSLQVAKEMAVDIKKNLPGQSDSDFKNNAHTTLIFASLSLSDVQLDQLMSQTVLNKNAVVVFRGVRDPHKMLQSIQEIQSHTLKHDPAANAVLDPTLFRDYNVTVVPTIIQLDFDGRTELGRASGITSMQYIDDKIKSGSRGNFGNLGEVSEILEQDMILAMQNKMREIDWVKKKEEAQKRFWMKQQFNELPKAAYSKRKIIDPTVVASADIKAPDGRILIPKGSTRNPLAIQSFNNALVVFDPTDNKQIEQILPLLPELQKAHSKVTLIATKIDREGGWEFYKKLTERFNAHVFTLTPEVKTRFELTVVPSIVTAKDKMFIVEELGPNWPN